uniref:Uncharacterized protein n=1 Tax=Eutreptiella gymnastica TaxID=73025 RepID=A0A7S4FTJ6_9EUGL|eukprot:CAMPEP_0174359228 /NCGR_PEP_ID=MMETSP0811_2-20130205/47328_1 /TAXON_ID=73025 ORGANISM="Eutreptiella gymnastica-like, Strain CCMP1594" /NCGR_SAMPLE_ID=MMETSP0811_2 /ASSEMBLY_ACC=CAM_ASM_000667 /LENGTH=119 /DNA_ID=CAMNT_0015493739 /DNA_START=280 /DNA_END=639 /DNA_ORIENTATION=+
MGTACSLGGLHLTRAPPGLRARPASPSTPQTRSRGEAGFLQTSKSRSDPPACGALPQDGVQQALRLHCLQGSPVSAGAGGQLLQGKKKGTAEPRVPRTRGGGVMCMAPAQTPGDHPVTE